MNKLSVKNFPALAVSAAMLTAPFFSQSVFGQDPVINEFVTTHNAAGGTAADDLEFIEVYDRGGAAIDLSAYTLVVVDGDNDSNGVNLGIVDQIIPLTDVDVGNGFGWTDDAGYWCFTFAAGNEFEDGSLTIFLITDDPGLLVGDDLDTDAFPGNIALRPFGTLEGAVGTIIDAVSRTDGASTDLAYTDFQIAPGFDGPTKNTTPGAASRIPSGTDTDLVADWVRNNLAGAGFAGDYAGLAPGPGEAFNTPCAESAATLEDLELDPQEVAENLPIGTVVGYFATVDPQGSLTFTYTLVAGTGDTDNASFTITDNALKTDEIFDFEVEDTYNIRVRTEDAGNAARLFEKTFVITIINANDPPVAADDAASTAEDVPITFNVTGNDVDQDGTIDTATVVVTQGLNGSVVQNGDGTVTYSPDADFNSVDTFTYTVMDNGGATSNSANVVVTVTAVNDAPVAQDDVFTVAEDSGLTVLPVLADNGNGVDEDPDGTVLAIDAVGVPSAGGAAVIAGTNINYTPALNFNGVETFTYTIKDEAGAGLPDTATVTVNVTAVNDPPVAGDDEVTTDEDTPITFGIVGNDADPADPGGIDVTTVVIVTAPDPLRGSVADNSDGTVTFTPTLDYNGFATFTYTVDDLGTPLPAETSNVATVTVNINAVNDAPLAADDVAVTPEDTPVTFSVTVNDSDAADGGLGGLDLTMVEIVTPPDVLKGGVVENGDGMVTFTPALNFNGDVTFTYTVEDLGGPAPTLTSNVATVTVTVNPVNDPPVAGDDEVTTDEDTPITFSIVGNDADPADPGGIDVTEVNIVTAPDPLRGSVVENNDGTVTFTPTLDYNGFATFTYTVDDLGTPLPEETSNVATVTVNINAVNDAPVAADDVAVTPEDTPVTFSVVVNDSDAADGGLGGLDVTMVDIVTPPDPAKGGVMENGDGMVTFTPALNFNGDVTFTYTVEDVGGPAPTLTSNVATVTVTVNPVNDPPVAGDDEVTTDEDTPITVNVAANDTDVEDDLVPLALGPVVIVTDLDGGTFVNPDGTVTYTPPLNANNDTNVGSFTFTYTIGDSDPTVSNVALVTINVNPVNDNPVANDDAAVTTEETAVTINLIANDTDVDGHLTIDGSTVTIVGDAANGFILDLQTGVVVYTPEGDFTGVDTFMYTVMDDMGGLSNVATVVVTVTEVNDPPVAVNDVATTDEDTPVTIDVADNDFDIDVGDSVDPTTVAIVADPDGGAFVNPDGTVTYTPPLNGNNDTGAFTGPFTFTYTIMDDRLPVAATSNVATVTVNVIPVNDPPVANDDVATTAEDTPITFSVTGNDTDVDGNGTIDVMSVVASDPANGTVADNDDGTVTYTPDLDFNGVDTFTYTVDDDDPATSNVATVTVNVTPVNDPPVANDDVATTDEDTPITFSVTVNDTDADGNGTIDLTSVVASDPAHGTVADNDDGTVTYTPDPDFNGVDTFTYTVLDDDPAISNAATVTVTVNPVPDNPVANDDAATTDEDTAITFSVTVNDTDGDGNGTIDLTSVVASDPANGTVDENPDGTVTYTPDPNFNGVDTFTYTVEDTTDLISNVATVTVTVNPINDPPVAEDDAVTTDEDDAITIVVLGNDTNIDGASDPLTVVVVSGPSDGGVAVNLDGTITYTPGAQFNGTDTFSYRFMDDGDPLPAETSNTAVVTVNVVDINDFPVALDDAATTLEDVPVTIDVALNDDDEDGTLDLTSVAVVVPPTGVGADATPNPDGTITYTPPQDLFGVFTFTYTIEDNDDGVSNEATVTVTVIDVNDPPVAMNDAATTFEDVPVTIDVTANDQDVDDAVEVDTVVIIDDVSHGATIDNDDGTVTYTPDPEFSGFDSFTYEVDDEDGDTSNVATVTIEVIAVNDPPVALDDAVTIDEDTVVTLNILANDDDEETAPDPATVVIVTPLPALTGGLVDNGDGNFTYTPAADFSGVVTFSYEVNDFGLPMPVETSNVATVTISVTPINDAPVAANDAATTDEDTPVTFDLVGNDTDTEVLAGGGIDAATVLIVTDPDVAEGDVDENGDGTITFTPAPNFNGVVTFTYSVMDLGGPAPTLPSNVATVTVTVVAINDPPVANDDVAVTPEDTAVTVDVAANDTDVEDDLVPVALGPVVIVTDLDSGAFSNGDGTVTYTPPADENGVFTFTYTIGDSEPSVSNTALVTITVNPVNDPPVANDDAATTDEDTAVTVDVAANDTDVEDDLVPVALGPVVIVTDLDGGAFSNGDGTVTYTPPADENGVFTFTYTIGDSDFAVSDTALVTITVNDISDAPVAEDDAATTDEDVPITVDVADNDYDPDTDGFIDLTTVVIVSDPTGGADASALDGTVTYTPLPNANGVITFTYTIKDDDVTISNVATVTITINPVNDDPVAADDSYTTDENTPIVEPADGVLGNDSDDVAWDPLTVTMADVASAQGAYVDVNTDGSFTYDPTVSPALQALSSLEMVVDTFTYTISDGNGGTDWATVSITVTGVSDPPEITEIPDQITAPGVPTVKPILFTVSDPDTVLGSLDVTVNSSDQGLVLDNPVSLALTPLGGGEYSLVVTPEDENVITIPPDRTVTITVTVDDGDVLTANTTEDFVLNIVEPQAFPATRYLPREFTPGIAFEVSIDVKPAGSGTSFYAVSDIVPVGWVAGDMSHNGRWVPVERKVVFGPFFDEVDRIFTYSVMPAADAAGTVEFDGYVADDKDDFRIFGCIQTIAGSTAGQVDYDTYLDNTLEPANPAPLGGIGLLDNINGVGVLPDGPGDNVANIFVYGMGLDPAAILKLDSITPLPPLDGDGNLCFTYTRSKTAQGLTFKVQKSTDGLYTWQDVNVIHTLAGENEDTWTLKALVPTGGFQNMMLRLVVGQQAP